MYRLVRSATLQGYAETARAVGLDPYQMLATVGLPRACLDQTDSLISATAACRLLEVSAAASGVEDFGLRMCEKRRLSILGPLSLVIREEPTLRDALNSMLRYMSLHSEAVLVDIEESADTLLIRMSLMVEHQAHTRQADEMVLGSLFRMLRELIGPHWQAQRVCFLHGAPKGLTNHMRIFGKAVEFDSDFNGFVCASKDLQAVPPAANPEMAQYTRVFLDSLLAQTKQTMTEKVRRLVYSLLPTGQCSVERVASQLGVDRRTVHRRLVQEGTTFSCVLDEVRESLAVQYLGSSERAVGYVAELLGFSVHSAFARWFRGHFGCSPSDWRTADAQRTRGPAQTGQAPARIWQEPATQAVPASASRGAQAGCDGNAG